MPFGVDVVVYKVLHRMFALIAWQAEPLALSLKADPVDVLILQRQYPAVKPGYHLNKKHWITVTLDGSIPEGDLKQMIDDSYTLVVARMTRADQAQVRLKGKLSDGAET
jgi:predicted DNA-binding protein (MmcQ/YjbR family)